MIRPATLDDLDAIMAIERASFPEDAWSEAAMRAELAGAHGRYLVVEEAGRILGYGGLRALPGAADADVQTIALTETARGQGRGRALLRALLAEAAGAREAFLDVRDDNPAARSLYASEGFVEIGRRPRYYPGADAVVMRLDLPAWRALHPAADDPATHPASSPEQGGPGVGLPDAERTPDATSAPTGWGAADGPDLTARDGTPAPGAPLPTLVTLPDGGARGAVCGPDGCS